MQDTIDIAITFGLIDNSVQGSFKLIDIDTGEILTDDGGNEIKIRGKKNIKPYLEEHKDIWRKLYDKVYEKLSQKDNPNVRSFEEMLQMNVEEAFGVNLENEEM